MSPFPRTLAISEFSPRQLWPCHSPGPAFSSGFCWAALTNTRATGQPDIGLALDNMVWDMAHKAGAWKP